MAPNFRTLDLNLLRVFDALMAEGSATRAAATLAMTQPAVSQALRRLRDALGDELFARTPHGLKPTPRAEWLWPQVRGALAALRQAIAPGAYDPAADAAQWRLAMADATAALLVPGLVSIIERRRALANLRVIPLATRDPRPLLTAGDADLALGFFPNAVASIASALAGSAAPGAPDAMLRHARLYDTRYVCVMRRGHPLAGSTLTLDRYCAAHHLLVSFSGRAVGQVERVLAALGRRRRIVLTVNQFFTAGRVVAHSDLVTVLPESFLSATGDTGDLAIRELPFALPPVHVEMLWHLRHDADPAHRWLRDQVLAVAGG